MVNEFVPSMIEKNHGHIITTASMASFISLGGMTDYACTKASALAFHEGLAQELKYYHKAPKVRTTSVHPSWTRTPMVTPLLASKTNGSKFAPALMEVETVTDAIVAQIVSGKSGQLILPPTVTPQTLIRSWPSWMQEVVRNLGSQLIKTATSKRYTRLEE
jgi:short-subunit dehydrogenase